ncbi:c-type cytochrome [Thalassococcus sp. CAU 1522]|uniref:C-type cytochrome n=1 Tax=Thalassococcus arenae TaxID=2851652 RepID=A0ABS6N465_9RHOB|nr:c-type cytochrome [Thalassococcus arenae]MBV2358807.1 c-type cytochrome [Thalassococcus arenae]
MTFLKTLASAALVLGSGAVHAQDSALVLGKSTFSARCAICHGDDGKGGGEIAGLFSVAPADLTGLSKRAGGAFPFSETYRNIAEGMDKAGHGDSQMPIWGEYFIADSLVDRGVTPDDAAHITQGRILAVVYYLQSIQE